MVAVKKYHGTGNDFIVVDAEESIPNRRDFAADLCDRSDGLTHEDATATGADGVLFLAIQEYCCPPRVVMTLVQPDGSVAAMCGNGARCAAAWVANETDADEVMIDTQSGTRHAEIGTAGVTIEMGEPEFAPAEVPLDGDEALIEEDVEGLTVTAVNTGVPHAVAFVDDVTDVDLETIGPKVRNADVFPDGANVTIASERPDADAGFDQRTFERGVEAETDSCGTGAVAIVAAARKLDKVDADERVPVYPPGGRLVVRMDGDTAILQGPVEREFSAEVSETAPRKVDVSGD